MNFNFDLSSNLNYNSSSYFSNFGLNSLPPDSQVDLHLGTEKEYLGFFSVQKCYLLKQGEIVFVSKEKLFLSARRNCICQQGDIVFVRKEILYFQIGEIVFVSKAKFYLSGCNVSLQAQEKEDLFLSDDEENDPKPRLPLFGR